MLISNLDRWQRRAFGYMVFDGEGPDGTPAPKPSSESPPNPAPTPPAAVTFTTEQLSHVNKLIEQDRANRQPVKPEVSQDGETLGKVLKHLGFKSVDEALKPKKVDTPAGTYTQDDLDRVKTETETGWKTRYDTLSNEHKGFLGALAEKEIETAAHEAKFMKSAVKDAAALMRDQVRWNPDTKSFDVVDAQGNKRINFATAKPMTVSDLVTEFATARPHMIEGSNAAGAGSGGAKSTPEGKTIYSRESLRDPEFYEKNRADILKALGEGRIK